VLFVQDVTTTALALTVIGLAVAHAPSPASDTSLRQAQKPAPRVLVLKIGTPVALGHARPHRDQRRPYLPPCCRALPRPARPLKLCG
jgi:hypothetical protein